MSLKVTIIVLISAIAITVALISLEKYLGAKAEKKKHEARRREFEELLTAAGNGDTAAMRELFQGRYSGTRPNAEQADRFAFAQEQYQNWQNCEAYARGARERYKTLLAAESPVDALKKLTVFVQQFRCLNSHNQAKLSEELRLWVPVEVLLEERTRALYSYLVGLANLDRSAFEALRDLIEAAGPRIGFKNDYAPVFTESEFAFAWPERWNEWALQHYDIPAFHDFAGLREYRDVPVGVLSDMAIKAINSRNPLELAIVLAYCNEWELARDEIGDMLYYLVVDARESTREPQPSVADGTGDTE